jgi:hypothetical protein
MELRALISQACSKITEDMCQRVIINITVLVEEVARGNGGHTEHLFHRGFISMQFPFFLYVSFYYYNRNKDFINRSNNGSFRVLCSAQSQSRYQREFDGREFSNSATV